MKNTIHVLIIICALALAVNQATAQITITKDDLSAWYTFGDTLVRVNDSLTTVIDIGDTGRTAWDFSGLVTSAAMALAFVDPLTTPHTADFPSATTALETPLTEFQGMAVNGTLYFYHQLTDTTLVELGVEAAGSIVGIPATVKITRVPYSKWYTLPATMGSYWTSADTAYQIVTIAGFPSPDFSDTTYASSEFWVDAWGPMTLPDGTVHTAIRIREHLLTASGTVRYEFLGKDGSRVAFTSTDPNAPPRGAIGVRAVEWNGPMVAPTAVTETPEVPRQYSLEQNYPNPFNPSTTIRYGLPEQSQVKLEIFNIIGQHLATLVDANQEAGYHTVQFNASALPSGMYFYRVTTEGFVQTMKMMLTK